MSIVAVLGEMTHYAILFEPSRGPAFQAGSTSIHTFLVSSQKHVVDFSLEWP